MVPGPPQSSSSHQNDVFINNQQINLANNQLGNQTQPPCAVTGSNMQHQQFVQQQTNINMRMQLLQQSQSPIQLNQQQNSSTHQMQIPTQQMMHNLVTPSGSPGISLGNQHLRASQAQQTHQITQQNNIQHSHHHNQQQHNPTSTYTQAYVPHVSQQVPYTSNIYHQSTSSIRSLTPQQNMQNYHQTQHNYPGQSNLPPQIQPEFRIYEMNKRLASRPDQDLNENFSVSVWWDSFANEFFDQDAKLSIRNVIDENVSKNFTISRTLIPRFFRSIYDGGVTDLNFNLNRSGQTNFITANKLDPINSTNSMIFESDLCTMTTKYGRPMYAIIFTEGQLFVEFNYFTNESFSGNNDPNVQSPQLNAHQSASTKIKSWIFTIRRHQELVPRSTIAIQQDQAGIEQLSKNITKAGLAGHTLNYLKLCSILEPMQEIMARSKSGHVSPRECLKQIANYKLNRANSGLSSASSMIGITTANMMHPVQQQNQTRTLNEEHIKNESMFSNNNKIMNQTMLASPQLQAGQSSALTSAQSNIVQTSLNGKF